MYSSRKLSIIFGVLLSLAAIAAGQIQDHGTQSPPARMVTKFLNAVHNGDRDGMRAMLLSPPKPKDRAILDRWIEIVGTLGPKLPEEVLVPVTDSHMDEEFAVVRGGYASENYMVLSKQSGSWKILPPSAPKQIFGFSGAELAQIKRLEGWARDNWRTSGHEASNGPGHTPEAAAEPRRIAARQPTTDPDQAKSPPALVVSKFLDAIRTRDGEALRATVLYPEKLEGKLKALLHGNVKSMELMPPTEVKMDGQCAAVRGGQALQPYMLLVKRNGEWKIASASGNVDILALTPKEEQSLISVEDYARAHWINEEKRRLLPPLVFRRQPAQPTRSKASVDPDLPRPTTSPALRLDEEPAPIAYRIGEEWVAAPLLGSRAQNAFRLRKAHPAGHMQSALVVRYSKSAPAPSVQVLQEGLRKGLGQSFPDLHVIESAETTLGGQRAASMVFTGTRGSFQIKGRAVMTTANGVLAELIFMTDEPEYDRESPSFQHVLDSFEFTR